MTRYILRRLVLSVPTLFVVSVVLFGLLHLAPGGPMAVYASSAFVDPQQLAQIEKRLGLDEPIPVQYAKWGEGMLTGNWGLSYKYSRPVTKVVGERVLPTLELVGTS